VSSSAAYNSIRHALTRNGSPLNGRGVDIYLQGSYGNDTNIYGDSDVDVVVYYDDTFFHDPAALSAEQRALHAAHYPDATYTWQSLRDDVLAALRSHYGSASVTVGSKSLKVQTSAHGRPSDVIPAVQYRRYSRFNGRQDLLAHWGVQFFDSAGNAIVNYPKYHIERGIAKNHADRTSGQYKSTVRIFKNLRNRLVDEDCLADGVAPSYFIECALHNVPDALFRGAYATTVPAIIDHLLQAETNSLLCQNGVLPLIGPASTQWSLEGYAAFALAAKSFWLDS
jgi:hypothetical protein